MSQTAQQAAGTDPVANDLGAPDLGVSDEELRLAYTMAVRSRSVEEHIVRLASRGDVKFAIWGPGEEIHGTATASINATRQIAWLINIVPHVMQPRFVIQLIRDRILFEDGCLRPIAASVNAVTVRTAQVLRQEQLPAKPSRLDAVGNPSD